MRRIVPHTCTLCKKADAVYDSAQFSTVQLCESCQQDINRAVLDYSERKWNPLVDLLCAKGKTIVNRDGETIAFFTVKNIPPDPAFPITSILVVMPEPIESDIYFPDPLDILG